MTLGSFVLSIFCILSHFCTLQCKRETLHSSTEKPDACPNGIFEIPDDWTSIDDKAFWECLTMTGVIVPDSVKSIGNEAFYDSRIYWILLGNGVETIGERAFFSCRSLQSIHIPGSVREIGAGAFGDCIGLMHITLDPTNTHFMIHGGALYSVDSRELLKVPTSGVDEIPDFITSIGEYAFLNTWTVEVFISKSVRL